MREVEWVLEEPVSRHLPSSGLSHAFLQTSNSESSRGVPARFGQSLSQAPEDLRSVCHTHLLNLRIVFLKPLSLLSYRRGARAQENKDIARE